MTEEATIFVVFFPTSWPPPEVTDVSQGETPLGRLIFRLAPSGSIAVIVHGDHAERTLFEGQPIAFSGPPGMLIDVVFADGNAEVRVNGQQLRPLAETSDVLLIETRGLAPEELPSFLRADATEICAGAIQRRRDWLAGPARIPEKWKEGARPLSDESSGLSSPRRCSP